MTGLVRKPVLPSLVRQVRSSKRIPDVALMIHPTVPAVRRQDVRQILHCLLRLTEQTAQTAASTPVIILVIPTVRRVLRLPTPAVAADRPVTDVTPKHAIILINPVVRRVVPTSPDVLAGQLPFLTVAAELVQDVHLAVTHLLQTGVRFTQLVTPTVVLTER